MEKPRVLRDGRYTIGGAGTLQTYTQGTNAQNGALGLNQQQFLGWYDLRPWEGVPEGLGQGLYDRNTIALESGEGRVRFTLPWDGTQRNGSALNPIAIRTAGALANIQLGSRGTSSTTIWQPDENAGGTTNIQALSTLIVGIDSAEELVSWKTDIQGGGGSTWQEMDAAATDGNTRFLFQNSISVGPEIISELAHGPAVTYDLEELGGGSRFVGVWLAGYFISPTLSSTQSGITVKWQVENCAGAPKHGPITFAYPVRAVQSSTAAAASHDATFTVAQWSLQRFGHIPLNTGATDSGLVGCSVMVANGGVASSARIDYHVGTCVDETASPVATVQAVAAGAATGPSIVRLAQANTGNAADLAPPYSYASLQYFHAAASAPPDGVSSPAIIFVTVG